MSILTAWGVKQSKKKMYQHHAKTRSERVALAAAQCVASDAQAQNVISTAVRSHEQMRFVLRKHKTFYAFHAERSVREIKR